MSTQSQIRDPIHGVIYINQEERVVIESPAFQRLRMIKQLGFADFAFPGATHSRYAHSLGAMNFAGIMFDRVFAEFPLSDPHRSLFRQAVRLAALLHDIGHPPLSHTTEMIMPKKNALFGDGNDTRASHEDYTLKIIRDSSLGVLIQEQFGEEIKAMIVGLVSNNQIDDLCMLDGLNYGPLLHQIISSEIDADRMDYLLRDSFFCGVNYGKFDSAWLNDNLIAVEENQQLYLGIKARAIFAFEDFLLSRYHMFASVYLHHTPVIMEKMLARYFSECPKEYSLATDIEEYISHDDIGLWWTLQKSSNPWAKRIVGRKPYVLVSEQVNDGMKSDEHDARLQRLNNAQIDVIASRSKSILSKYFQTQSSPLFVKESHKAAVHLEDFSSLFLRYQRPAHIDRIYVDEKDKRRAQSFL